MINKVLIAYGSRFGSTEEISIKMKETIEKSNFVVDLVNLKSKKSKLPDISDYTGVLIGSGIRIGRWTKEAMNFLKENVEEINRTKILVGIFLSSGEASDPEKRPEKVQEYLVKVLDELRLKKGENIIYDAFGGVFDLSKTSNLGWLDKKMLKTVGKDDPKIDLNGRKDYRDWDQINTFVEKFIAKLQ